jgi:hypothetical protein
MPCSTKVHLGLLLETLRLATFQAKAHFTGSHWLCRVQRELQVLRALKGYREYREFREFKEKLELLGHKVTLQLSQLARWQQELLVAL